MERESQERFARIGAVFDAALELPAPERAAFLDLECAGDAELRQAVEGMLRAHERSEGFLAAPAAQFAAPLLPDATGAPLLPRADPTAPDPFRASPQRVGPFRILREIGRGGMGIVFLAERDDGHFEQRVALKLVRGGIAGDYLVRRFLEERQILASLQHPGIARLLDGGITPDGMPYFAMEYIEGEPLDRYCDTRRLGPDQRIELFKDVCAAVQYAHRNLVVHRDLKPSNILVTPDGQVKLLDFGIARLLGPPAELTEEARTRTVLRAMTPEYASPEQVRGEVITTASDVYSLGVVLYELLAGQRPFTFGSSPDDIAHAMRDPDPVRPSSALRRLQRRPATSGTPITADGIADARGTSADRLWRRLRGDLDTIVMKALQKEPARRYGSAAELMEDLQRARAGMPVLARPDSALYRARKFVGRHRVGVAVAAVLAVLVGGFGVREQQLRTRAEAAAQRAEVVKEYLTSVFEAADPFQEAPIGAPEITARELLDRGAARIDAELGSQPELQAEMLGVLGRVYRSVGLAAQAAPMLERSLAQRRSLYGERHVDVAEALSDLGGVYLVLGRYDEAEPLLEGALAQRRQLLGPQHPKVAASLDQLATLRQEQSRFDEAETLFRQALDLNRGLFGPEHLRVVDSLHNLALVLSIRGEYDRAEPLYREALAIRRRELGVDHPSTAQTLHNLAQVQQRRGEIEEAETLFRQALAAKRRALGDAHPSVTVNLNNLAELLFREKGEIAEAEALVREALALDRRIFGDEHPYVAAGLGRLATMLGAQGRFTEAEALLHEALAMKRKLLGEDHSELAINLNDIATLRAAQGDMPAAAAGYRQALENYRRRLGDDHLNTLTITVNLAGALREQGELAEADSILEGAILRLQALQPQGRRLLLGAQLALGRLRLAQGLPGEALDLLTPVVQAAEEEYPASDRRTADAQLALGTVLRELRRFEEAEPLLLRSYATLNTLRAAQPRLAALARTEIAQLYVDWGRPERARSFEAEDRHTP